MNADRMVLDFIASSFSCCDCAFLFASVPTAIRLSTSAVDAGRGTGNFLEAEKVASPQLEALRLMQ